MRADIFQERIDKKLEKEKRKVEFRIPEKQAKKKQKSITALAMAGIRPIPQPIVLHPEQKEEG